MIIPHHLPLHKYNFKTLTTGPSLNTSALRRNQKLQVITLCVYKKKKYRAHYLIRVRSKERLEKNFRDSERGSIKRGIDTPTGN